MVRLRLRRIGLRHQPSYRIMAADKGMAMFFGWKTSSGKNLRGSAEPQLRARSLEKIESIS